MVAILRHSVARCMAVFLILAAGSVHAEELDGLVRSLRVLPLAYGVNKIATDEGHALIIRGEFDNGNAWGGDIYTVLVEQDGIWHLVRHRQDNISSVLTDTIPHTDQDSIKSVRFMVPKNNGKATKGQSLYLLVAQRHSFAVPDKKGDHVGITLYKIEHENDFGVLYFQEVSTLATKKMYCNVDQALYKELGIDFPDGDAERYACVK